ncbi:MAG: hypothetical protein ACAH80_11445 [Alphaproteobacteria bacterium]
MTDLPEISPDNRFAKIYADDSLSVAERANIVLGHLQPANPDYESAKREFDAFRAFVQAERKYLEETLGTQPAASDAKPKTRARPPAPR